MRNVFWLASYPKSGNTWLRALLEFCLNGEIDINALRAVGHYAAVRAVFDEDMGLASGDLTADEVLAWRPDALRLWAARTNNPLFLKTHDARVHVGGGVDLIPADVTAAAVYLVRDPRDVALSLARHMGISVDAAVAFMADADKTTNRSPDRLHRQLPQIWSSWSNHVESWTTSAPFPVLTVAYERMRAQPRAALVQILSVLRIACSDDAIDAALDAAALDRLREQERKNGFREQGEAPGFFGQGLAGGWRDRLTAAQVRRIETDHGPAMRRLGYLD